MSSDNLHSDEKNLPPAGDDPSTQRWFYDEKDGHVRDENRVIVCDGVKPQDGPLLAAAPALLAALKALDAAHNHNTLCRAKERARAIIAQAEGR